ncbi:MAG TPA: HAD family hydrolase [Vicinamibacterales bacterium]|nr:HAD family hydrolase [Vicinamibacterales bacterium]
MPVPVRAVLCDLDDTLFDHTHASRCAVAELQRAVPDFNCWSIDEFAARHRDVLDTLHIEVLAGRLTISDARIERFRRLLVAAACRDADQIAPGLAGTYRRAYETSWQPVAGALPLLTAIRQQAIRIAIVTNNIVVEQQTKLRHCGLTDLVDALVTSEEIGVQKPDPRIFHAALGSVGAEPAEAVMVGDTWATDIEGARAAGVRPVWLNRFGAVSVDPTVAELNALVPTDAALRLIVASQL